MPTPISELTLDEIVALLIQGEEIEIAGGGTFGLTSVDSRSLLAFYNQDRRAYWNPDRDAPIQKGEIDRLLIALDAPPKAPSVRKNSAAKRMRWRLTKIETHRFRGLHRHCGDQGRDPSLFVHEFNDDITLLRGFNGAGKTSLLSAVCWCLTGIGYRSQGLPSQLHEPVEVEIVQKTASDNSPSQIPSFKIPPIVPIPSDSELILVDGESKMDTWVRLHLQSLDDLTQVVMVERRLVAGPKGTFTTTTTGIDELSLGEMALQVGTVMPGIAAAMRFDDRTTLSQAVSILTGIRPLGHFGSRCDRLHDRLTGKYTNDAEETRDTFLATTTAQIQTLADLVKSYQGMPELECVVPPNSDTPLAWEEGLATAKNQVAAAEATARTDAALILGSLPRLGSAKEIENFVADLDTADSLISSAALRSLPSMDAAMRLGKIEPDDIAAAEAVIEAVQNEAKEVAERLADEARSKRMRLYTLVARWHEEHHPGEKIHACPVCQRDLTDEAEVPPDALLSLGIAEALEACRAADAATTKTGIEWERDRARAFLAEIPLSVRRFATEILPETLLDLYRTALQSELFNSSEMPRVIAPLAGNVSRIWTQAIADVPTMAPHQTITLPSSIPNTEGLRDLLTNVANATRLARLRMAHGALVQRAIKVVLQETANQDELPANERPLRTQIEILRRYAQAAQAFGAIQRQLEQITTSCRGWSEACERIKKLARAAQAIEPFRTFPDLVQGQIGQLINDLNDQATSWANHMYRAQYIGAPSYAGLHPDQGETFNLLAARGRHRVSAHHVMNASALRAFLWAFVLALWAQIWERSGGIACLLMDDPQDLLDPANVANLASSIPNMIEAGMNPLLASNDFSFLTNVQNYVRAAKGGSQAYSAGVFEFSAISSSKATASLSPILDDLHDRCRRLEDDENNPDLVRSFVYPVRVRIETKLWDLLCDDPVVLHDPTLNDLLDKIHAARKRGERPFNEEPFRLLIELPCLLPGTDFRGVINKAHHGKADQITPTEAAIVREHYRLVLSTIDACWVSYARFMRRLPPEEGESSKTSTPPPPQVIAFPRSSLPMIGRLAAHQGGTPLVEAESATETFEFDGLGQVSLYTVRAATLGLIAIPGQTLIVSVEEPVRNGDLAIAQVGSKVFARRIGLDRSDPSRIALESVPSTSPNVPPTYFVPAATTRLNKIIGVLFDDIKTPGIKEEAVPAQGSQTLSHVTAAAQVIGDSAFPVARDGDHVLVGPVDQPDNLIGRIVAVITRDGPDSPDFHAFLKRLGKAMPGQSNVHYLENVGQIGEGEYIQVPSRGQKPLPSIPVVERLWKVHGVVFNTPNQQRLTRS